MTEPAPDPPEGGPKLKKKIVVVKKKVVRRVVKRKDGTIVSSTTVDAEDASESNTGADAVTVASAAATANSAAEVAPAASSAAASASAAPSAGQEPPARTANTRMIRRKSLGKSSMHSLKEDAEPELAPGRELSSSSHGSSQKAQAQAPQSQAPPPPGRSRSRGRPSTTEAPPPPPPTTFAAPSSRGATPPAPSAPAAAAPKQPSMKKVGSFTTPTNTTTSNTNNNTPFSTPAAVPTPTPTTASGSQPTLPTTRPSSPQKPPQKKVGGSPEPVGQSPGSTATSTSTSTATPRKGPPVSTTPAAKRMGVPEAPSLVEEPTESTPQPPPQSPQQQTPTQQQQQAKTPTTPGGGLRAAPSSSFGRGGGAPPPGAVPFGRGPGGPTASGGPGRGGPGVGGRGVVGSGGAEPGRGSDGPLVSGRGGPSSRGPSSRQFGGPAATATTGFVGRNNNKVGAGPPATSSPAEPETPAPEAPASTPEAAPEATATKTSANNTEATPAAAATKAPPAVTATSATTTSTVPPTKTFPAAPGGAAPASQPKNAFPGRGGGNAFAGRGGGAAPGGAANFGGFKKTLPVATTPAPAASAVAPAPAPAAIEKDAADPPAQTPSTTASAPAVPPPAPKPTVQTAAPTPKPAVPPPPKPAGVTAFKPAASATTTASAPPKPAVPPVKAAVPAAKPAAVPAATKGAAAAAPAAAASAPAKPRPPVKRKIQASGGSAQTSNNVYVFDPVLAWVPARLLGMQDGGKKANVKVAKYAEEKDIGVEGGAPPTAWVDKTIEVTPKLYGPTGVLPLQNVDKGGQLLLKEDMVDLAFLHEAAILFNIKARHVLAKPYTRTGDIVLAVNPYQWLEHLYTQTQQMLYAETLVWDYAVDPTEARRKVPPHVYETSALSYRGLALSGGDQSILVSGESGAGKTETVKICMNHIAMVQGDPIKPAGSDGKDGGGHKVAPAGLNMVVQRVVQSNPILEVFGNAKTRRNDNSSRFGKYVQLQFDRDDVGDLEAEQKKEQAKKDEEEAAKEAAAAAAKAAREAAGAKGPEPKKGGFKGARVGIRTTTSKPAPVKKGGVASLMEKKDDKGSARKPLPKCKLAGSKCEVYLLEKSRVVMHDTTERTYHIFYAIVNAKDADKKEIWSGLIGKGNADFKYVGHTDWQQWDGTPDTEHYAITRSNLATIGVTGEKLMSLMVAITVVLQCGQLVFTSDPNDKEKCVVSNKHEFDGLSELSGVPAADLLSAFTQRTMITRGETFVVPLKPDGAKDSCDAFAKEIYSKAFLWLVREINAVTCAEDNYDGQRKSGFVVIGLLDIFGFESFPINGFEQLCINYANEKLQAKFTKDIFKSVEDEYRKEGISLADIRYDDNSDVLELIESRSGLCALLDQECMRPKGNAKEFVYKVRQEQKASPCLIGDKFEGKILGVLEFGIHHYAGKVIYNADEFLLRNTDTIAPDLFKIAEESSNLIISKHLKNESMMNEKEGTRVQKVAEDESGRGPGRAKSGGASDTLWTKFRTQLTSLMKNLSQTQSRYIRCIKPNTLKLPLVMQHLPTVEQLRCAGVVAAVTITRSAFPSRLDHKECFDRYHVMYRPEKGTKKVKGTDLREEVDKIMIQGLEDFELDDPDQNEAFVVGKTRIYFRAGVMEYLEQKRAACWDLWAMDIQRVGRGFLTRLIAKRIRMERFQAMFKDSGHHAVPIQRKWRKIMEKKREAKARFEKIASFAQNLGQNSTFQKQTRKVGKLKINPIFGA